MRPHNTEEDEEHDHVLGWFEAQGARYQTRINTVLRVFKDASSSGPDNAIFFDQKW